MKKVTMYKACDDKIFDSPIECAMHEYKIDPAHSPIPHNILRIKENDEFVRIDPEQAFKTMEDVADIITSTDTVIFIENQKQLNFFENYFNFKCDKFIEPDLYTFYPKENGYTYAFIGFSDSIMLNDFFIDDIKESDNADTEEGKAKIEQLEMRNETIRKLREDCINFFIYN